MKLPHRRNVLHLAAGAAALPVTSRFARTQAYPTRPVRIIYGFSDLVDIDILVAVQVSRWLSHRLGQSFVVAATAEDRLGLVTNLATETVVRAAADGYTLLFATYANAINATLYPNLNFNFIRDITPIASIGRIANIMEVNPSFPATTVGEFISYAKANPGKVSYGSDDNGTTSHMSGELFKLMTGVNMIHVPYRSAFPALPALSAGQVQVMFDPIIKSIEPVRAGKLRPLAVTTSIRSPMLPAIPAVSDFLPGYESSAWFGFAAPKGTPIEVVDRLNKEINAGLADPELKARLADWGVTVTAGSPADFGKLIADETEKWGKVIRAANIKPE
jgi:tripartite-type tricarboxylate transporter receptor subunit TctC